MPGSGSGLKQHHWQACGKHASRTSDFCAVLLVHNKQAVSSLVDSSCPVLICPHVAVEDRAGGGEEGGAERRDKISGLGLGTAGKVRSPRGADRDAHCHLCVCQPSWLDLGDLGYKIGLREEGVNGAAIVRRRTRILHASARGLLDVRECHRVRGMTTIAAGGDVPSSWSRNCPVMLSQRIGALSCFAIMITYQAHAMSSWNPTELG